MRSRIKDLHYQYCVPKPKFHFRMVDTEKETYDEESEEAQRQRDSIDIYVDLVL